MKIERPMDMARRIVGDTCAAEDGRVLYEEAIRARDTQVLQALGFALAHADPFPMLRGLAEDLGGEVRACSRCGDALGAEEIGGTCELPTPSRDRLIVDGHSVMCAEFGGDGPTAGCPGCALPPRSLSAQVRARLGKGDLSLLMNTSRPASRLFSATWHREYQDGVVSDRRDAEGPDVDACLRAVLAWEDSADREQPEHAPPALPGPAERVDMALRFRYRGGVFVVPEGRMRGRHTTMGPHHYSVLGLRVRIVYEHSAADAEAAKDCAESWRSRMLGAGAREVECVGEVEK